MLPFIAKAHYYNDATYPAILEHTSLLLYADSFTEATKMIEDYFGNELDSLKLTCVACDGTFFEVPNRIAEVFIAGEGNFRDGKKNLKAIKEDEENELDV